jgi:uncharacterized membrane protein (UPF0127 family)
MSFVLVRDGIELAPAEIARSRQARRRGLLGRDSIDGAIVLEPCRHVHTVGMRFPIDVAACTADGRVLHTARLAPWRLSRPKWRTRFVVEAKAGSFERWGLRVGDVVVVRPEEQPA